MVRSSSAAMLVHSQSAHTALQSLRARRMDLMIASGGENMVLMQWRRI